MKTKVIEVHTLDEFKVKLLVGGSYDDVMCIKCSCEIDKIPNNVRKNSYGLLGVCCEINTPQKDPDRVNYLIWINTEEISKQNRETVDEVLLHEIVHVKQFLEKKLFHDGDKWPGEIEARVVTDLFRRARKAINED